MQHARSGRGNLRLLVALVLVSACAAAPTADAESYAPVNRLGPKLTVPKKQLAASLRCNGDLADPPTPPVLLAPATAVNSEQNFGDSYEPVLRNRKIPYCASDLPGDSQFNMTDIQGRADYLVYAIRSMYARAGKRIAIIGSSQGGEAARWPLRFWPKTRLKVSDVIALDSPNHGTTTADGLCATPCAPSLWQQTYQSNYMQALNSRQETFAGIAYTNIATYTDDFVEPNNPDNSTVFLTGPGDITNVAIQDICPGAYSEHLLAAAFDRTAIDLSLDAIQHRGPASPARIDPANCNARPFAPDVPAGQSTAALGSVTLNVANQIATAPTVPAEPELACYVRKDCPDARPAAKRPSRSKPKRKVAKHHGHRKRHGSKTRHRT